MKHWPSDTIVNQARSFQIDSVISTWKDMIKLHNDALKRMSVKFNRKAAKSLISAFKGLKRGKAYGKSR